MISREILGYISIAIAMISYLIYFVSIFRGHTKPHVFTWFIWGIVVTIAFLAQLFGNGGPGTWVTGFSALVCFVISVLALFKGEKDITKTDWIFFVTALISIPLWYFTKTPIYSVILIVIINIFAFIPTFRKSYSKPYEEPGLSYVLAGLKYTASVLALKNFSFVTASYSLASIMLNVGFVTMLLWRRSVLGKKNIRGKKL